MKWHFDENEKLAETSGEDLKGINKRRAREYHVSGRERTRAPSAEIAAARAAGSAKGSAAKGQAYANARAALGAEEAETWRRVCVK